MRSHPFTPLLPSAAAPSLSDIDDATQGGERRPRIRPDLNSLRIVHVTRTPVGGIFRHILDVASGQAARGHKVGIVCDSSTGGARAEAALAQIAPQMLLGVARFAMQREIGPADALGFLQVARYLKTLGADVLHGHGAKGGAFMRLLAAPGAIRVYTPHGGSLHYGRHTLRGMVYGGIERALMRRTELFLFESAFARGTYQGLVGKPRGVVRVVANGISTAEMVPVVPNADAADIVCVGEFRAIKGTDVMIDALAELHRNGRRVSLAIAGDGEEGPALRAQVERLGLGNSIRFLGHTPARHAFAYGRLLVVPSRADSLPYVVIEAGGAGIPIVASGVGGIPEIVGPEGILVPPEQPAKLAAAVAASLDDPTGSKARADNLRERIQAQFSQDAMVEGVLAGYGEAIAVKFMQSH
jgi:glycosyltransferase involved in cell wall biosynthesis